MLRKPCASTLWMCTHTGSTPPRWNTPSVRPRRSWWSIGPLRSNAMSWEFQLPPGLVRGSVHWTGAIEEFQHSYGLRAIAARIGSARRGRQVGSRVPARGQERRPGIPAATHRQAHASWLLAAAGGGRRCLDIGAGRRGHSMHGRPEMLVKNLCYPPRPSANGSARTRDTCRSQRTHSAPDGVLIPGRSCRTGR